MTRSTILFLLSFIISLEVMALDDFVAKIETISKSGKTIRVNRGEADNLQTSDFGILLAKEFLQSKQRFIYRPIARIRAIKVYQHSSIWVVYKQFKLNVIDEGKKFLLFSETALLKGRAKLKIKKSTLVVSDKKSAAKEVKDFLFHGDDLAVKEDNYEIFKKNHPVDRPGHINHDVDLLDVETFKNRLGDDRVYRTSLYKGPQAREFSESHRVHTFEKMMVSYLNKFNDPKFDYDNFFQKQKGSDTFSETDKKNYLNELKENGPSWSKEYTDDQLGELLHSVADLRETERREALAIQRFNYQGYLSFGVNFAKNDNIKDTENQQPNKIDYEFSVEGYYLKDFKKFRHFTLEISGRFAQDSYYATTYNALSEEYSLAIAANWYPFFEPGTLGKNIFYVGGGIRFGFATLTIPSTGDEGMYQVSSLPVLRAGLKYNLKSGYGFRVTSTYENINTTRLVQSDNTGNLPDLATYKDLKIGFGISKFF